jgi:hypothetical protein
MSKYRIVKIKVIKREDYYDETRSGELLEVYRAQKRYLGIFWETLQDLLGNTEFKSIEEAKAVIELDKTTNKKEIVEELD